MATYIQADRPLAVWTPLGPNALLLVGFSGHEAISRLFSFQLDLLAENDTRVSFEGLLGQRATVRLGLSEGEDRYVSGICSRISQGSRDETFTAFRMEVVPEFWFLTRIAQSRIFQQKTIPEILREVLAGLAVDYQLTGQYERRDYCVQYRETDFNFASRLMEEEGIFYFFKHTRLGHRMVVADSPSSFPEILAPVIFDEFAGGNREEDRVYAWEKTQELRSGKVTLWDHCFELPHKHLEAQKLLQESVPVGTVTHKLKISNGEKLELYDYPGEYAQRFDGVNPGGGDRPADVQKLFTDNQRTATIRMQEEAVPGLMIQGASSIRDFTCGSRFTLQRHFDADGPYVLTGVHHAARLTDDYRSGGGGDGWSYSNSFTCIPAALPYRPARMTPKPFVQGTQTAVVVGPPSEEIFTDKYGRVKVQFHWDRQGQNNADSSCWVRVAQVWAGRRWGASFWPRIGQEVVVTFEEGDPDRPIIIGSVYNADQMPPYLGQGPDGKHPNDNKLTGVKSNSTKGGSGYNEWRFDDTKGQEQFFLHAQRNMDVRVLNDTMERVLHDRHLIVGRDGQGDQRELVAKDKHLHVKGNQVEQIEGNMELLIGGAGGNQDISIKKQKTETIGGGYDLHIKADRKEKVDNSVSLTVGQDQQAKVGQKHAVEAGQEIHLRAGMKVILEAGVQLTLKGPGGFVDINPSGVTIQGTIVLINSGGSTGSGSGSSPTEPKDAKEARPINPMMADDATTGTKSDSSSTPPPSSPPPSSVFAPYSGQGDKNGPSKTVSGAAAGNAAAGGGATDAAAGTAEDLIKSVKECDGGTGIWEKAKAANGGKDPAVVVGAIPGGFGAQTDRANGKITIKPDFDPCTAKDALVFELTNLSRKADFDTVDNDAAAGKLSRKEYQKGIEKVEYDNITTALKAGDGCKKQWGCKSHTSYFESFKGAKDFDDYYDNYLAKSHKEAYGKVWDSDYKASYEKQHPKKK
jgi:type VI secretion system secreted protein VgrG